MENRDAGAGRPLSVGLAQQTELQAHAQIMTEPARTAARATR